MKVDWSGVFPAVPTQFHDDFSIDLETTREHVEALIANGVHGLIMLGTIGENCSLSLDEKDSGEVIAEMELKIKVAKILGHGLGRQLDLFPDRTPVEDRAYEAGLAAGKLRKPNANPYDPASPAGQAWQRGMNEGTEFINKDLEKVISSKPVDPFPGAKADKPAKGSKKSAKAEEEKAEAA